MASRFPSLEEFDEGSTTVQSGTADLDLGLSDDPTSDFLSRERATLGEDAGLFASPNDGNLLGGDDAAPTSQFESSFPSLDMDNTQVGPGGTVTGTTEPYLPGTQNTNAFSPITIDEEETEVVKQWRGRQAMEIQTRDATSETRKKETIEKAQRAVDDFYENYNQKRDKAIEETRREAQEFLDSRENTVAGGTTWERIAKLVDLSDKGMRSSKTDKTRFREMLISLRKDEKAPGASGF